MKKFYKRIFALSYFICSLLNAYCCEYLYLPTGTLIKPCLTYFKTNVMCPPPSNDDSENTDSTNPSGPSPEEIAKAAAEKTKEEAEADVEAA